MPTLATDILGQVERLPLRPSEGNALLPLFEAISNSLHAINDRFSDRDVVERGRIDVEILRDETHESVIGFSIGDNGVGLDEDNYTSFQTPFSRHKIKKGGKGVGRLGWLKVFRKINVESVYFNGGATFRGFEFVLRDKEQLAPTEASERSRKEVGTTITLQDFHAEYGARCPSKTETIVQRIIGHFLPIFAGEKSPLVIVKDHLDIVDVRKTFAAKIVQTEEALLNIDIDGAVQPIIIRHMRCDKSIRPRGSQNNWMCFCANDRGVKEYGIDDQIGLKLLDGEEIYVGAVTGDYLDSHVNPQRTDFIFENEDGLAIRRQLSNSVKEFLRKYVDEALAQKRAVAASIITKNPQYLYLKQELDKFVEGLRPGSVNEEAIYGEMSLHRFRRQRRFNGVKNEIDQAPQYSELVAQKVEEYKQFILADQKGTLAEYVTKRKAVLDLLDKLRGFKEPEDEKHHLEDAVHKLLCPMRVDSHELTIDDHNLWILDDRLAFYSFFASDRPISQYTESQSDREPDLAFFYESCIAWRESDRVCDTIIIVEFKRPGLEAYSDKNDPFMQLMDYVSLFKSGATVRDRRGAVISGIGPTQHFIATL